MSYRVTHIDPLDIVITIALLAVIGVLTTWAIHAILAEPTSAPACLGAAE